MPLQNRVLPDGQIIATPARGTLTGNRGILHGPDRVLGTSRWRHKAWICCVLDWQGRKRQVMTGRNWTELFFLDEATAFAAGHRPCAYCRRDAYTRFQAAWTKAAGQRPSAPQMDAALHRTRVTRDRQQITHLVDLPILPVGTFIRKSGQPHLVTAGHLHPYTPAGYAPPIARPTGGCVTVMTPAPTVAVLSAGYRPIVHASAE